MVQNESRDQTARTREDAFDAIRLSNAAGEVALDAPSALIAFPTSIVDDGRVVDLDLDRRPGLHRAGAFTVEVTAQSSAWSLSGSFQVSIGAGPVDAAEWQPCGEVPDAVLAQLPRSVEVPALEGAALRHAVRRAHLAAENARRQLLEDNQGLVRSVVNRYRAVVRSEASSLELADLVLVGEHQLLDVVERCFTGPDATRPRDVAWSKLVQRAIGGAVRAELARATGISVEFRQLLSWFHTHPADRSAPVEDVAWRMAFDAGVTRLMAARMLQRTDAAALLEEMLDSGSARYVPPTRGCGDERRRLRSAGVFVISPRSSLAEISRAQSFRGTAALSIEDDLGASSGHLGELAAEEHGFSEADTADFLRRTIDRTGMSPVESLVWLHRSGALDPHGCGSELPEIAVTLGLSGRAEARAALRRARRKLDAWSGELQAAN